MHVLGTFPFCISKTEDATTRESYATSSKMYFRLFPYEFSLW